MRYCFIACDNGLGHTRRVISVCREIEAQQPGAQTTLLAGSEQGRKFGWNVTDFATGTTRRALEAGERFACRWHERLPDLDGYDVVVSDNLPEVLERRSDAILMGTFLWHQVLENIDHGYRLTAEKLLAKHRPPMMGSGLFASRELKAATRFVDVGLFKQADIAAGPGTDLLIACGYTDECLAETAAVVRDLVHVGSCPYRVVHVEPRVLPARRPEWMVPADFSAAMFSALGAAVIRPGLGTVTEALQAGARVFCFYEPGNGELKFNAQQLDFHGYGTDCGTARRALDAALDAALNGRPRPESGGLEFEGARRAAAYLASRGEGEA